MFVDLRLHLIAFDYCREVFRRKKDEQNFINNNKRKPLKVVNNSNTKQRFEYLNHLSIYTPLNVQFFTLERLYIKIGLGNYNRIGENIENRRQTYILLFVLLTLD